MLQRSEDTEAMAEVAAARLKKALLQQDGGRRGITRQWKNERRRRAERRSSLLNVCVLRLFSSLIARDT